MSSTLRPEMFGDDSLNNRMQNPQDSDRQQEVRDGTLSLIHSFRLNRKELHPAILKRIISLVDSLRGEVKASFPLQHEKGQPRNMEREAV